jgi:FKBP-type peptidyl-prolyl cis-trans isomerase
VKHVAVAILAAALLGGGCKKTEQQQAQKTTSTEGVAAQKRKAPQVDAPFDLKNPPADATRTPSGLILKTIATNPSGQLPKRNDTVMIKYTGWRQESGETFFSNINSDTPMPLNLSSTAKGFTEAMQLVHKGEKAMLWLPPSIGLKDGQPPPGQKAETLVYEVEVVDIQEAPAIPTDTKAPPADALTTKKNGIKYVVVRPGTGKDKPRSVDEVTFNYTAWDPDGRMVETTEMKKRPAKSAPYRQSAAFEEVLEEMTAGERARIWIDAEKLRPQLNAVASGPLCVEVEVLQIDKAAVEAPPTPPDVAKPAGDAKKTAKGVFYKLLKPGKGGPKPKPTDSVKVHYTGWTTDGRMFDSSVIRNEPSEFSLQGVIAGWTDGIPQMSVGDKMRFWIPEELAYKGQPGKPQGMLVFEIELLEIAKTEAK